MLVCPQNAGLLDSWWLLPKGRVLEFTFVFHCGLLVRTRLQGLAPLGGNFTFFTGSKRLRRSHQPMKKNPIAAIAPGTPIASAMNGKAPFC